MGTSTHSERLCLGPVSEFAPGTRRIVLLGKQSVGVFNVKGSFYAIRNFCPHEAAQLCLGKVMGTNLPTSTCGEYEWGREGMILRCPWHGWEFDLEDGRSLFDPRYRVKTYQVEQIEETLWLSEFSSQ